MSVEMPRPRADPEELLDTLVDLFLVEGFAHLTLADLAARLHRSKTTLYALGQSKEQVTVNAVRHFFRTASHRVEAEIAEIPEAAQALPAYLRAIARELRPASPAFVADLHDHAAAHAVYERNTAIAARRTRELIAQGVAHGEFRDVHAAFAADTVAATMARIQSGAVRAATELTDAEAYDELAQLVLDGIRTPASTDAAARS